MTEQYNTVANVIKDRRSVKPFMMNGRKIAHEQVQSLLELADWAPTHGLTEPWRFVVYANSSDFCHQHAELYKTNTPATEFIQGSYDNFYTQGDKVSHVIVTIMQRGNLPKIPVSEEVAAVAAAIQNVLLGATALHIASFWSTGGMILKPAMHSYFNLREEDQIMGVIYLGYADEYPKGVRRVPLSEKVVWK
ncbi:nitroreductase [Mucilaginibacter calamicampi]|uniref:Putative NAD(P)H nitroreductase n=1 Tax=Mucilaginibacter calamicampi TaxID=1302352 RepID=A0ABW2YXF8_9SPHI